MQGVPLKRNAYLRRWLMILSKTVEFGLKATQRLGCFTAANLTQLATRKYCEMNLASEVYLVDNEWRACRCQASTTESVPRRAG